MNIFNKFLNKDKKFNEFPKFRDLYWEEFYKEYKNTENAVLIDVRTLEENQEIRIPGAILIDFYQDNFIEEISKLNKDLEYFVYCKRGIRSVKACNIMYELGFTKITNLTGGITNWYGPTESDY